jgi:hypothetical protein
MADAVPRAELRTAVFSDISKFAPNRVDELKATEFTRAIAESDAFLLAQLPFYQMKPLYVTFARWTGPLIGSYSGATVLVSAVAFTLFGFAVWALKPTRANPALWGLVVLTLTLTNAPFSFSKLASASSPDTLAGAFFIGGCVFLMRRRSTFIAAFCWACAVLARPDYMIGVLSFVPVLWALRRKERTTREVIQVVAIPAATYIAAAMLVPRYGLQVLLAHAFLGPFPDPAVGVNENVLSAYIEHLQESVIWMVAAGRPLFFIVLSIAGLFLLPKLPALLALAALLSIVVKVALFPSIEWGFQERYYFPSYFLVAFAWIHWYSTSLTRATSVDSRNAAEPRAGST